MPLTLPTHMDRRTRRRRTSFPPVTPRRTTSQLHINVEVTFPQNQEPPPRYESIGIGPPPYQANRTLAEIIVSRWDEQRRREGAEQRRRAALPLAELIRDDARWIEERRREEAEQAARRRRAAQEEGMQHLQRGAQERQGAAQEEGMRELQRRSRERRRRAEEAAMRDPTGRAEEEAMRNRTGRTEEEAMRDPTGRAEEYRLGLLRAQTQAGISEHLRRQRQADEAFEILVRNEQRRIQARNERRNRPRQQAHTSNPHYQRTYPWGNPPPADQPTTHVPNNPRRPPMVRRILRTVSNVFNNRR